MITLDIEDNAVKIVTFKGNNVVNAIEEPLEPGLVKDGVVLNPGAVGQIIADTVKAHGITEKNVIASVSGIGSIYRVARLPKLSGDIMSGAIKQEMSRLIPVPLDDLYTSWQIIPADTQEVIVPIIAIPKENIDFTLSAIKEAGLNARVIDVKPLVIARVADETTAVMINVQPNGFDIVIVVDSIPQFIRSLPFSDEAKSLTEKARELGEELERTVNFYNSSDPAQNIPDDIDKFVSGPLKDIVKQNLNHSIKSVPELLLYPDGFNADSFVPNLGLALKQSKIKDFPIKLNLNVIPAAYLPKPLSLIHLISWVFIVFAAIIIIFNIIGLQQVIGENNRLQSKINTLNAQIEIRSGDIPELDALRSQLANIEKQQSDMQLMIATVDTMRDSINSELNTITGTVTGNIDLTTITYADYWSVKGNAPDPYKIINYVFSLRDTGKFDLVQLSSMSEVSYNQWNFIITLNETEES
jgi:Tfp pilus assembly PilM family ATPase